jgi:prepilin-type processing-associated H-X9-DG protein
MEQYFAGYLLNALEPETEREVEAYLRKYPEANRQMDLIRQALEPLEADAKEFEPPPSLILRTLARTAELSCGDLPHAPAVRQGSEGADPRWWRRTDVLVAGGCLVCMALLVPPAILELQHMHQRVSCENNLGPRIGLAFIRYADRNHGAFPNVASSRFTPRNVCGMAVSELVSSGVIDKDSFSISCPGTSGPAQCPSTVEQLRDMSDRDFQEIAPRLAGCYAYSMGYHDQDGVHGFSRDQFPVPLMADRPPFRADGHCNSPNNSPNHGGAGQNVLFTDGHVAFLNTRLFQGDDIYLNRAHEVAPGKDPSDTILGVSEAQASPLD